eukprot:Skav233847  [mRNA]  locus=scaffold3130:123287:127312:- [translate_table: standard]
MERDEANAVSSRSHAVCIIRLKKANGMLVLVDCAGSERKKDLSLRLAVICTASPCATDTEHTISTLRLGATLAGFADTEEKETGSLSGAANAGQENRIRFLNFHWLLRQLPGGQLSNPSWLQLEAWIEKVHNGAFADILRTLPSNTTGQMLVRFTIARCQQLCSLASWGHPAELAGELCHTMPHLQLVIAR